MSERTDTIDTSIEINDLPPEETLTAEEKEELAGAGRRFYRPSFEVLEAREMLDAGIGARVMPVPPPSATAQVQQVSFFVREQKVIANQSQLNPHDLKQKVDQAIRPPTEIKLERKPVAEQPAIFSAPPTTGLGSAPRPLNAGHGFNLEQKSTGPVKDTFFFGEVGGSNQGFHGKQELTFTASSSRGYFEVTGAGAKDVIIELRDASGKQVGKSQYVASTGQNVLSLSQLSAGSSYTARVVTVSAQPPGAYHLEWRV